MKFTFLTYFYDGVAAPFVRGKLFGRDVYLLIDSGANISMLNQSFFDEQDYNGQMDVAGTVLTANGGTDLNGEIHTTVEIEGISFPVNILLAPHIDAAMQNFVHFIGEKPVGMLGIDFLVRNRMTIDFGHWCMYRV